MLVASRRVIKVVSLLWVYKSKLELKESLSRPPVLPIHEAMMELF